MTNMRRGMRIRGFAREDTDQFPIAVVREAIVNAIAHRDYSIRGEGIRVLMLCGRDDPQAAGGPSFDELMSQMEDERINKRAQTYLRDLRRDAVIEYN